MMLPVGFSYHDLFLSRDEQISLVKIIQTLPFKHDRFRGQTLKRRSAQFGYAYLSTGRKVVPSIEFPPFLTAIAEKALPHCPPVAPFQQCIITHYSNGAGIGWHTDADRFGECIIGVSLGATARMEFRPRTARGLVAELLVTAGSLYVMTGPARWEYEHRIIGVKDDRYSLTLRQVRKEASGDC